MKKNFIKKLLGTLLIINFSINVLLINYVQATSEKQNFSELNNIGESQEQTDLKLNEFIEAEEKIMMYDAKTKETTEVNMEQLKQELSTQNDSRVRLSSNSFGTAPYTPPSYITKNMQNKSVSRRSGPPVTLDIVNDTSKIPYINVCRLSQKNYSGGSCALVGPHIALTAAHCVFDKNNQFYEGWTLYPGYNGFITENNKWYGTPCGWSKVYYSDKWLPNRNQNYDWAICILEADVGNQVGYFGTQGYYDPSVMKDMEVRTYGYPGDYNELFEPRSIYQYTAWGQITSVDNYLFDYYSLTFSGMSGGPIVHLEDVRTIVGLIKGVRFDDKYRGVSVRITENMVNIIRANL